jgi:hypothetical protein
MPRREILYGATPANERVPASLFFKAPTFSLPLGGHFDAAWIGNDSNLGSMFDFIQTGLSHSA